MGESIPESLVKINLTLSNHITPIHEFSIQKFSFFHLHENQAQMIGWHGWDLGQHLCTVFPLLVPGETIF